jgi:hypothetical protein
MIPVLQLRKCLPPAVRQWVRRRVRSGTERLLRGRSRQRVLDGPFRGMWLPAPSRTGLTVRYVLGTHERELHPVIERLVAEGFGTIINCGAAQGYYAIGFALRCPHAHVIAFEARSDAQADLARAAEVNAVRDRIALHSRCDARTLQDAIASAAPPLLVLCDIEGDELTVLDAAVAAGLKDATVLVETHDRHAPGATDQLLGRFAATHRVEVIAPRDRTRADIPSGLTRGPWRAVAWLLPWVMREGRAPEQRWLLFTPRSSSVAASNSLERSSLRRRG